MGKRGGARTSNREKSGKGGWIIRYRVPQSTLLWARIEGGHREDDRVDKPRSSDFDAYKPPREFERMYGNVTMPEKEGTINI